MSHEIYEVISDRFSLADEDRYILTGTWPRQAAVKAILNGEELPASVSYEQPVSAAERARDLDRDWGTKALVTVDLPSALPKKGQLKIFMEKEERRRLWYTVSVDSLELRKGKPQFYLEESIVTDTGVRLRGWVIAQGPVDIFCFDEKGKNLGAKPLRTPRPDVEQVFSEAEEKRRKARVQDKPGFFMEFPRPKGRFFTLTFRSRGANASVNIDLWAPRIAARKVAGVTRKGMRYFRDHGAAALARKATGQLATVRERDIPYEKWAAAHAPGLRELKAQREKKFANAPLISVVVPLYRTPEKYLKELIDSVRAQTYPNWELVLSDGSGKEFALDTLVEKLSRGDERIRLIQSPVPLKIVPNTNQAIRLAKGDYIAFADHDDVLTPNALYEVACCLEAHPGAKVIYSDEDKMTMDGHKLFQPHFKPDYNGHLLCTVNYICHLMVAARPLLMEVAEDGGVLRDEYEGAQDYDLILRLVERVSREEICHVPKVLYHWRAHEASTAENPESKAYAFEAGRRAIEDHYARIGRKAVVKQGEFPGLYTTRFLWREKPLVTVLIPNKDHVDILERCLVSISKKSVYRNLEFLIVENNSTEEETFAFYERIQKEHLPGGEDLPLARVIRWEEGFSYAAIHNFAVPQARGEYVLLLNNDTELISEDAIGEMLSFAMEPEVGAVGARLYYEDDTIQHAGVVIGFGSVAGHCFVQQPRGFTGYMHRIICTQEYSAVTAACMMVRKSAYLEVGGLCEDLAVAFNDIDFCLKLRKAGYLVVYAPYAQLYHYESKSRGLEDTPEKVARFNREVRIFETHWADILRDGDPYYNPNLTLKSQDFSLKRDK